MSLFRKNSGTPAKEEPSYVNPYDGKTESLLEQYNRLRAQRDAIGAEMLELREELDKRSNITGMLENSVIDGKAAVLAQAGVPAPVIEEATRRVTARREAKVAARAAREPKDEVIQ